jgi:hypothetical protein
MAVKTNADEWLAQVEAGPMRDLLRDIDQATMDAARSGVWEAQQDHPYTDRTQQLTNTAHPEKGKVGESHMVWPMFYAGFVNDGTSRSRPYPFVPIALAKAREVLEEKIKKAVERMATAVSRK